MTLDELRSLLEGLQSGHFATISRELCVELFAAGKTDAEALMACAAFAKTVGAEMQDELGAGHVKLVKIANPKR